MEMPKGFTWIGIPSERVLKLKRALYSLKQSGRQWWIELSNSMEDLGFKRSTADAGVYFHIDKRTSELIIALVYVDDSIFMGQKGSKLLIEKHDTFMKKWECHDLGTC